MSNPDPDRRELRRQLKGAQRVTPPEYTYASPEDFVLRHGTWYTPTRLAAMPARQCYGSSLHVATVYPGWRYVEGYALAPLHSLVFPHAWVIDADGEAVELTWRPFPGLAYLGVEFAVERADDCTWDGDACVLDDCHRRWPLLREPWQGERGDLPRSDRLKALAAVLPLTGVFQAAGLPEPPTAGTDQDLRDRWAAALQEMGPGVGPDEMMGALTALAAESPMSGSATGEGMPGVDAR